MIREINHSHNDIYVIFSELVITWNNYLSEEVHAEVNQSRGLINKKLHISIDFVFQEPLMSERKFIEYVSSEESLLPGTLRYFVSSEGICNTQIFFCESILEIKSVLLGLHFTKSYQNLMLKYVS